MRSINLKLVLLYVASALLIVVSTVAYTEYMHSKQNNYTATMMMESGPAFIDGETPWDFESKVLQRGDDINQVLSVTGLTAFKVYSNYLNGLGNTEGDGSFRGR